MKRLLAACIILAASALLFTSCGSKTKNDSDEDEDSSGASKKKERVERSREDEEDKEDGLFDRRRKIHVGFCTVGFESDWRRASNKCIEDAAARRPQIDLTFADAMQRQENQIKVIRTFIRKKVDVIAFSPVVASGFEDILKEAKKAKIPVVLFDRAVDVSDPDLYVTIVGSDFTEEGRRAARWLLANVGEEANIAVLSGTVGSAPAIERQKGFEEVIKDHPGLKIILSQSGEFTRTKGKEVMKAFMKSYDADKINVLFAHNDDMALGAIDAIRDAGKVPGKDIVIISIDGIKDILKKILAGEANCTVECNPLGGPALFDAIETINKGQAVPAFIPTEEGVFDGIGGVEVGSEWGPVKTTKITQEIIDGRAY